MWLFGKKQLPSLASTPPTTRPDEAFDTPQVGGDRNGDWRFIIRADPLDGTSTGDEGTREDGDSGEVSGQQTCKFIILF